mgnify:CR=1 FL=1
MNLKKSVFFIGIICFILSPLVLNYAPLFAEENEGVVDVGEAPNTVVIKEPERSVGRDRNSSTSRRHADSTFIKSLLAFDRCDRTI